MRHVHGLKAAVRVTPHRAGQGRMFDMLTTFKNATIIDGSGMASFKGSVLVEGERIAAVVPASGEIPSSNPDTMIDCEGLSIMPGMTEAHCHISFNDLSSMYQAVEISTGRSLAHCTVQCAVAS